MEGVGVLGWGVLEGFFRMCICFFMVLSEFCIFGFLGLIIIFVFLDKLGGK